jgi:phosphoserine phosphatase
MTTNPEFVRSAEVAEPLASWNEGAVRRRILEFVARVTDEAGGAFVPPAGRVAIFDNDGTLWCEKPAYTQAYFVIDRLRRIGEGSPALRDQPPYKAARENDLAYFGALEVPELLELVLHAHAGMTPEEFCEDVRTFLGSAVHPRFKVPFTRLTYQPMVELLDYLRAHGFRVFIMTGGGVEFVRAVSEELYGVSPECVAGSAVSYEVQERAGRPVLVREAVLQGPIGEGPAKLLNIQAHIGRRPLLAAGNSTGDTEMLAFAQDGARPYLSLVVHHDDAEREYAYEGAAASFATTRSLTAIAHERGWTVVSMKDDFKTVFGAAVE